MARDRLSWGDSGAMLRVNPGLEKAQLLDLPRE
jgi:hypothetical protein